MGKDDKKEIWVRNKYGVWEKVEKAPVHPLNHQLTYLIFCQHCGFFKELSKPILQTYLKNYNLRYVLCSHCGKRSDVPEYVSKILDELIDTL